MNSSHVALAGSTVGLLTVVLIHLSHWPIAPLDEKTAGAYAGLIVMGWGWLLAVMQARAARKANSPLSNGTGVSGGAPSSADKAAP